VQDMRVLAALGLFVAGLVVLGVVARKRLRRSWGETALVEGKVECEVVAEFSSSSSWTSAVEPCSDFLRNLAACAVVSEESGLQDLVAAFPGLKKFKAGQPVNENTVKELQETLQQELKETWQTNDESSPKLMQRLATMLLQLCTVTPSVQALVESEMAPYSMYQPTFTLLLMSNNVKLVTEGFVGGPVRGPSDPNKKYTSQKMRLLTEDLVVATSKEDIRGIKVDFFIARTSATSTAELRDELTRAIFHGESLLNINSI